MFVQSPQSWATVVANGPAASEGAKERLEFRWKEVKKGRLRIPVRNAASECHDDHCQASEAACTKRECIAYLKRHLSIAKGKNIALATAFEARLVDIDKLRQEIAEDCKMDHFFSSEMEESRLAVIKARCTRTVLPCSDCISCQLCFYRDEAVVLNDSLSAAQYRLQVLREYRIANDREAICRNSSHFNKGSKYFIPVGSSKAKGVSALKPTLQMQSSYDVAALTTNSIAARPLKIAWKDKPKPLRIVDSSSGDKHTMST